jgi:hypothetical protein
MSAYLVGNDHLDLMVSAGLKGVGLDATLGVFHGDRWHYFDRHEHADLLKRTLHEANIASVNYRYKEFTTEATRPYNGADITPYLGTPVIPWGHVLGALRCFEYQSCEHPEWGESLAKAIVDRIRHKVCQAITDEADGMWHWEREDAREIMQAIKEGLVRA